MYAAGEYIPGDAQFEYESDVSIDETSSMDTNEHDIKKHNELYKRIDPDYYSFKVLKHNEDGELYHHKINIFRVLVLDLSEMLHQEYVNHIGLVLSMKICFSV
jgi:hypothetical protein